MRCLIVLAILIIFPSIGSAATIYVPDTYPAIQDAVDAAVNGDTIVVRPGMYAENIDFSGKAITVRSELGARATFLDGNQAESVVKFKNGEGSDSVLDGFTLINGAAVDGGGIHCHNSSSPTISNNVITGNRADDDGGGIFCYDNSNPLITGNKIYGNTAVDDGGGIYCNKSSDPVIIENIVSANTADDYGGGKYCDNSGATIENNMISENMTNDDGGGIFCDNSLPLIVNNKIFGNVAGAVPSNTPQGGGIYCRGNSDATLTNNTVYRNRAVDDGGGVFFEDSSPAITNCVIKGNTADDMAGGIWCGKNSMPEITNSVVWGNFASAEPDIYAFSSSSPNITYCDVQGGWPGTGNINADPRFVQPHNRVGDFHLTYDSPCKNVGDNSAPNILTDDFEGDPRIVDGTIDIGADEFHPHLYYSVYVPSDENVSPGARGVVKVIGLPGDSVLVGLSSILQDPPQQLQYGELYLGYPIKIIDQGVVSNLGVVAFPERVPVLWVPGDRYYTQALIGNDLSNLVVVTIE